MSNVVSGERAINSNVVLLEDVNFAPHSAYIRSAAVGQEIRGRDLS